MDRLPLDRLACCQCLQFLPTLLAQRRLSNRGLGGTNNTNSAYKYDGTSSVETAMSAANQTRTVSFEFPGMEDLLGRDIENDTTDASSSAGSLQVNGMPSTEFLGISNSIRPADTEGNGHAHFHIPLEQRCALDVSEILGQDRRLLVFELNGVLIRELPRQAGRPDTNGTTFNHNNNHVIEVPVGEDGEDRLFEIRPGAIAFLNKMRWEAGVAIGLYSSDCLDVTCVKAYQIEECHEAFMFDVVVHGDTTGAWEADGQKNLSWLRGSVSCMSGWLVDVEGSRSNLQDIVTLVCEYSTYAASQSSEVFKDLESRDQPFRRWLTNSSVRRSSFSKRLSKKDGEYATMRTKKSAMLWSGIDFDFTEKEFVGTQLSAASTAPPAADVHQAHSDPCYTDSPCSDQIRSDPEVLESLCRKSQRKVAVETSEHYKTSESATDDEGSGSSPKKKSTFLNMAAKLTLPKAVARIRSNLRNRISGPGAPDFAGHWVCVSTWGLHGFLEAEGIPEEQRKIAAKAPWPSWQIGQDKENIVLITVCEISDSREELVANGEEYLTADAAGQELCSRAYWMEQALIIERSSVHFRFIERRWIDKKGRLQFDCQSLERQNAARWGRSFTKR